MAHLACRPLYMAATLGLMPICTVASTTGLTLIYMLAMLGIHMLIEGVSKAQRCSFTSLDLVLPAAATLGLTPICMVASCAGLLPICIDASRAGLTPILICTNASHTRRI
jgi:hypothetical protein